MTCSWQTEEQADSDFKLVDAPLPSILAAAGWRALPPQRCLPMIRQVRAGRPQAGIHACSTDSAWSLSVLEVASASYY